MQRLVRLVGQRRRLYATLIMVGITAVGIAASVALRSPKETATPVMDLNNAELVTLGQSMYARHCASCHGANLEGQPNWKRRLPTGGYPAPPHDATGHTWHHADQLLFETTKYGGQASAPRGFRSNMPGFQKVLTDTEIWAVLAYIKSQWPADIRAKQAEATARHR